MLGSHGAGASLCTTSAADWFPAAARTTYPAPGGTLRNSRPRSELAFCVESAAPAGEMSDAAAPGARPVTYTCSTLPAAVKGVDAEAPLLGRALMTSHTLNMAAPARTIRLSGERVLCPAPCNILRLLTVEVDTPLWAGTRRRRPPGLSGTTQIPAPCELIVSGRGATLIRRDRGGLLAPGWGWDAFRR